MNDITAHVRAHAIPCLPPKKPKQFVPKPVWRPQRLGGRVLVFDTETTVDGQTVLVSGFRLYQLQRNGYELLEEGLMQGNVLDADGRRVLRRYARKHKLRVWSQEDFCRLLIVESEKLGTLVVNFNSGFDFGAIAWRWGNGRGRWRRGWRLQLIHRLKKLPSGKYRVTSQPTALAPRLRIRHSGPDATFIQWGTYGKKLKAGKGKLKGHRPFEGRFLDIRESLYALFGEKHSLESAGARFDETFEKIALAPDEFGRVTPKLIDHCRRDVELTWRRFLDIREEWNHHPFVPMPSPVLPPPARAQDTPEFAGAYLLTRVRTPASLAKGYFDQMGIRPRLEIQPDFPRQRLGQAMEAFYGGRIESNYQGAILPVVSLDIQSTYLSIDVMMQLHRWDTAAVLEVEDCTDEARELLEDIALDRLFDSTQWPRLAMVCEIELAGDFLPIRYPESPGDAPTVHMKRVWPGNVTHLWYALPDLIYSKLYTGKTPRVRRAWRLVPKGMFPNLRSVWFRGEVLLDPREDFYRAFRHARIMDVQPCLQAAHETGDTQAAQALDRLQTSMKAMGEPMGYGIFVEVNEKDTLPQQAFEEGTATADVWTGEGHFTARISREEHPGRFYFPPRGAIVTSGARLLLGMMERCVAAEGGAIVTIHTDSATVVATETGGGIVLPRRNGDAREGPETVHALSYRQLEDIRRRFGPLSGLAGVSLWKRERTNEPHPDATRDPRLYILSLGPGRYTLFNNADDGGIILRDRKETALGHLVPPDGYTREQVADALWKAAIRESQGEANAVWALPFAREPVLGRLPITTPDLLRQIRTRPRGTRKNTAPSARPFGFVTVAYTMSDTDGGLFGRHIYWSGWCKLKRIEAVGCPVPRGECPFRSFCPLAHPIKPVTYDPPSKDVLRKGRWFDWWTGRPLPSLSPVPVDFSSPHRGIRIRTWAEYIRHTLPAASEWWLDSSPDVRVNRLIYTGKEARHLQDIAASLRIPGDEVLLYQPEGIDGDDVLRPILSRIPMGFLTEQTRLSHSAVQRFRNSQTEHLHAANRYLLWQAVLAWSNEHPETDVFASVPAASSDGMTTPPAETGA